MYVQYNFHTIFFDLILILRTMNSGVEYFSRLIKEIKTQIYVCKL